ncbi:LamG domain-containing protein [Microbacterium sp. CFBP 8790]|uniref:LamG domain-containing protein n=1 Tax=unclassified Microbacterium TaxID=2609290 RepID=UPI003F8823D1
MTKATWQAESDVTASISSGQWHKYDLVYDGKTLRIYIDGVKVGENLAPNASVSELGTNLAGYLGRSLYGTDEYFRGCYDNVRVYNRPEHRGVRRHVLHLRNVRRLPRLGGKEFCVWKSKNSTDWTRATAPPS